jgi:hypothetical protein
MTEEEFEKALEKRNKVMENYIEETERDFPDQKVGGN